jgi:hypothetical protein
MRFSLRSSPLQRQRKAPRAYHAFGVQVVPEIPGLAEPNKIIQPETTPGSQEFPSSDAVNTGTSAPLFVYLFGFVCAY